MSTIAAGTTSTTALVSTADTTGNLVLQTNGTTTALTLNTAQAIGVGSSPSYGTSGQVLTSAGAGAAPTWNTVTPAGVSPDPRTVLTTKTVNFGGTVSSVVGSVYINSTTQMIVTNVSAAGYYGTIYDSTTDTMGSPVLIVSGTVPPGNFKFYLISSTSIILSGGGGVKILSISGTTITVNTNYSSGLSGGNSEIVPFGSSYVIYGYTGSAIPSLVAFTVSGTVVSFGSVVTIGASSAGTYPVAAIYSFSATAGLVCYTIAGTSVSVAGFTISGTAITVGTASSTLASNDTSGFFKGFFPTSGGRVLTLLADGSGGNYNARAVVSSISGTTLTNSIVASTNPYFGSSIVGPCFVQNGNAVLVVGKNQSGSSWSSIVLYDNAGTATASTETVAATGTSIGAAILTSATTIGIAPLSGNGNWTNISIVANAPSFTVTSGQLYTIAPSGIGYLIADSSVSKYAVSNGSNFYNVCTGSSGYKYLYTTSATSTWGSAVKPTGVTSVFLSNYYGTGFNDPTDAAKCWLYNVNGSTTSATFYRVQFA
jgi:hypothetical protein